MNQLSMALNEGNICIRGELTRQTLPQISHKKLKSLLQGDRSTVDLQLVIKVDTAGLAWLFHLLEEAQLVHCQLRFINLPTKLNKLIKLSGVERFLPN